MDDDALDIPLLNTEQAIAEVRRWLELERVDPEGIFTQTEDQVIRYKDLIAHLEQDTSDGRLLRFAISRGRVMRGERSRTGHPLFQIRPSPAAAEDGGQQSDTASSSDTTPTA